MPSCYQTVYDTGIPPHGADLLLLLSLDLFECASAMLHVDTFYSAGVKDAARRVCRQWLGQRDALGGSFTRRQAMRSRGFGELSLLKTANHHMEQIALADAPHWVM